MLKPGQLNHYVRVERRVSGVDSHGNTQQTWETLCHRWVKWWEDFAREKNSQGRLHSINRVVLKTWQDAEINAVTAEMRVIVVEGLHKGVTAPVAFVQIEDSHEIAITIEVGAQE